MRKKFEEVMIELPKKLIDEVDLMAQLENKELNEIIVQATEKYVAYKHEISHLHQTMQKGYEEMAGINLNLCCEAFLAEEEAKVVSDRLVVYGR